MKNKTKLSQTFFFISMILIIFIRITQDSELFNFNDTIVNIIKIIAGICIVIKLFMQKYSKKSFIISIALTILGGITLLMTKTFYPLMTILILIGMKDISIKKIFDIIIYETIIITLVHGSVFLINLCFNPETIDYINTGDRMYRYDSYFGHPNTLACILLGICMNVIYRNYDNNKFTIVKQLGFIMIMTMITYILTKSRTILILYLCFFVGLIIVNKCKANIIQKGTLQISKYIFPILSIIILLFLQFYPMLGDGVNILDNIMSRRLTLGILAKEEYGMTIIPQYVEYQQKVQWENKYTSKLILDNAYMVLAINYGIIYMVIVSIVFYSASEKCNNIERLYIILFSISCVTESFGFNIAMCGVLYIVVDKLLNNVEKFEERSECSDINNNSDI